MVGEEVVPMDDKAKRMRDLLSSFYSPDPSISNNTSKHASLDDINSTSFDPDQYMNILVNSSSPPLSINHSRRFRRRRRRRRWTSIWSMNEWMNYAGTQVQFGRPSTTPRCNGCWNQESRHRLANASLRELQQVHQCHRHYKEVRMLISYSHFSLLLLYRVYIVCI